MLRFRWSMVLVLVLAAALIGGCGLAQRFSGDKDKQVKAPAQIQVPEAKVLPQAPAPAPKEAAGAEMRKVTLYFSDPTGQKLVAEQRPIPKTVGIARATLQELIQGPGLESNLLPTIPAGTLLKGVSINQEGLARVDFSRELMANHSGGTNSENLTVYSIVNTLTQFPTVKRVEIMVEGKRIKTLAGHVDVSAALSRNDSLVAKQ